MSNILYMKGSVMTHEEKRSWIRLIATAVAYTCYVIIILGRANGRPLADVPYAATLLWTIGAAIVGSIVAEIVVSMGASRGSRARDVRDREIGRLGEYTGQWVVIAGAGAAMLMAMARWD